jgi:FtsP/CotA-like multicopper oxidase with cupredoxin domain
MMRKHIRIRHCGVFLVLALVAMTAGTTSAAEFYLKAEAITRTMTAPSNEVVTMWGYALSNSGFTTGTVTLPGPLLEVLPGDTNLTIHLKNNLPEPTSLVISGQITTMTPVWDDGTTGNRPNLTARVRSFTHEAGANGGVATYTWNNLRPGTYLYQSGTHPSVQVQMGLYGALKKDTATAQAYNSASSAYDWEGVLVLSEVDPALHAAVANDDYGPGKTITSTINYKPKYFLYHGEASTGVIGVDVTSIAVGDKILFRILNAGLTTRVPLLQGLYMTLLAEDGNLLPYPRETYSLTLPAGKTMDVMVEPTAPGVVSFYDRRGFVSIGVTDTGQIPITAAPTSPTTPVIAGGGGGGGGGCFISTVLY